MNKRYIIWAPALTRSAGTKALYALYEKLRARNCNVLIFCPEQHLDKYEYIDVLDKNTLENDLVVYPEIVWGNPLQFRNVVRLVFYFPGRLAGEAAYHPGECVFTWWDGYCNAPELRWPNLDTDLFYDENLPKKQNCYFVNKTKPTEYRSEFDGAVEINMEYPATRPELAQLLKTTKVLYTFDRYSVLNDEALACGAQVMVVEGDTITPYVPGVMVTKAESDEMFEHFIRITQQMNYQGELQDDTPFLEKFGGLHYKTAMRCAALGAWQQAFAFARKAWQGRPLPAPGGPSAADAEVACSPSAACPAVAPIFTGYPLSDKWQMLLAQYGRFVAAGDTASAASALKTLMPVAFAEGDKDALCSLFVLMSLLQNSCGNSAESIKFAEQVLLIDPFGPLAAHLCVLGCLKTGKVNLALVKACQLCCPFLSPLDFNKAFYGFAMFGLILNEASHDGAVLAEKIPAMLQNARETIAARLALLRKPGGWKLALGAKPFWL